MKTKILLLLLTSLLLTVQSIHCPVPKNQQTQLLSDSVQIRSPSDPADSRHLTFDYQFEESFSSDPTVSFGINELASEESTAMEIQIVNTQPTQSSIQFQVHSANADQWKSLKINLISTTRQDMEFGNTTFTSPSDLVATNETFDVEYPLQKDFSSVGLKVKPFIQGFNIESTDKQTIGVKLEDADVEGKKVHFSFSNPGRVSLVRSLSLCVIVFNIYTPGVLFADGIIDQNYVVSKTNIHIPRHGINELRTYIVGINSFHTSVAQQISISAAIDETFTLSIGPLNRHEIEFISVSYLILSIIDCGSCSGHYILYEGICRVSCPLGQRERNGKCVPIVCSEGYEIGPRGNCIPICPQNQVYSEDEKECVCAPDYYPINGACTKCFVGTKYNSMTMTCDSICGPNSSYLDGRCICYPGYNVFGTSCRACPKGTNYNAATQECDSICGPKEAYDGEKCICAQGYVNIGGKCGKCPAETTYNSLFGRCECLNSKTWHTGLNKCVPICTQFEELIGQVCQCKAPYVLIGGVCGACPDHSVYFFDEQKCYCKFGFRLRNGQCVCPDDQIFSSVENRCVKRCQRFNEQWINNKCDCPAEYERDERGRCFPKCGPFEERVDDKCVCMEGYHKGVYGPCVEIKCPDGFEWNPVRRQCRSVCPGVNEIVVNGKCQCVQGFQRELIYNICMPQCPSNMVRKNQSCVCSPGNKFINGICTNCPRYSQYVSGICVCYDGNPPIDGECQRLSCPDINHVYDPISKSCKCKGPLVWMRGKCQYIVGCGANEYWCGTECVCHYGYQRVNGACVRTTSPNPKCPPFSQFDVVNYRCVCNPGFYAIRPNVCERCPAHAYWDGYKCNNNIRRQCAQGYFYNSLTGACERSSVCGVNEYLDGIHCRCKLGHFMINGQCRSCPYGTYFDGLTCSNTHVTACNNPYKFWNGRACVCIAEFFEYGNTCVRCPAGTVWNGLCCKSPSSGIELNVVNGY